MAASGDGTVGKALEVLDQVASFGRPVRFSELIDASPFPKATLYRFVQTLTSQSMLAYDPDRGTYAPGVRLVRLAHAAWQQASLAPIARAQVDQLSADVGETVHLAQLDHAQVIYVDKRNAADPVQMYSQAGKVGPAYCTGVGKAMMAFLPEDELADVLDQQSYHRFTDTTHTSVESLRAELDDIRANGYGFDREEHEPGIICVSLPILSETNRVLGALSVTSTTTRTNLAGLESLVPRIKIAAAAIAKEASSWQFPATATNS
ncbi:transcriptional regulator, IclR family [Octadecabacter temperatus]|uniref:Transcriptional regulator KdgR n=1 Tax=Octadecabacter temperatus TaxID=1458307 RepID=A0A0K0Y8W2_9RHOB|nr:IclR family transcriptional regulator [Octadecabacter temperatus]AKS47326.1 Transcriptional regulator KdgR [Octadecabacter temperatus]SIO43953.1 transcriptional regulator, IclR family [Octadecabacter temperatus]